MPDFPFDIPKSLSVYIEQFENKPDKVIEKLRGHLERRGPDAVGYFLLAWFCHLKNMNGKAKEYAIRAKTFAPGSPLMEKLHYYLTHPDTFNAWTPEESDVSGETSGIRPGPDPVLDLDNLIDQLSRVENERITPKDPEETGKKTPVVNREDTDDIVSETLAKIYESQGKTEQAIKTYEQLKNINPDREDRYSEQISRLKIKLEEQQEEGQ